MKRLLNEDITRKFMKLANIEPLAENFLDKTVTETDEVTEEGFLAELDDELPPEEEDPMTDLPPMDDEPMDDEPMDDMPAEEPAAPGGDLDVTGIVQAVTDALAQELEAQGHPVDIDVADEGEAPMDDMPAEDPMDDMPAEDPMGPEAGEELAEASVEEELEEADINVSEELDEDTINEITRRVAERLLKQTKRKLKRTKRK